MSRQPMQREDFVALTSFLWGVGVASLAAAFVTAPAVGWSLTLALVIVGAAPLLWVFWAARSGRWDR